MKLQLTSKRWNEMLPSLTWPSFAYKLGGAA